MIAFFRLVRAEGLKLRHSAVLRLIWVIPILFLAVEFLVFERPFLGLGVLNAKAQGTLDTRQLKMVVSLWGGFLHPLVLALLPSLLFLPEHRFKNLRHFLSMPINRWSWFLA